MAQTAEVVGEHVVGDEAPRLVNLARGQEWQQGLEVLRWRPFADLDQHADGGLGPGLGGRGRLVARADAGSGVGPERERVEARRMPVDRPAEVVGGAELGEDVAVAIEHGRHVHHLGQPQHVRPAEQLAHVCGTDHRAGVLPARRGHARRGHEEQVERQPLGRLRQPVDAGDAQHVADLVRVGDHRRRPHRHDEPGKLGRREQRALQVHVRIDQPRDDDPAADRDRLARRPCVPADARDPTVDHDDVGLLDASCEDVDDAPARQQEVARLAAQRDANPPGDRRGIRVGVIHRRASFNRPGSDPLASTRRRARRTPRGAIPHRPRAGCRPSAPGRRRQRAAR